MALIPEPSDWSPPERFDGFVVERPLGAGGMGRVFVGRDESLDRPVALKFIASEAPEPAERQRFLVEARAIARLSHPNVVGVYRIGEAGGVPYIAYELVSGQSLDRLARPLSWPVVLRLAAPFARGLEAAHAAGVLHRDIKLANVVLSERGEVKLIDFGLAKVQGLALVSADVAAPPAGAAANASSSFGAITSPKAETQGSRGLTRPGTVMGTPAYIAPEVWRGEPATARSDIFALGLVLYELLAGRLPHAGLDADRTGRYLVDNDVPPLRSVSPEIPESFAALVDRCVRRMPVQRYADATELRAELEQLQLVFLPASAGVDRIHIEPDRLAVAQSMSRIRDRLGELTERLYARMFELAPEIRALFPEDMGPQRQKLAHMLQLCVDGLGEPERLVPVLEDLGHRHRAYGVSEAHFDVLGRALQDALASLDDAWNAELERAWTRAFAFITSAMRRGLVSEAVTVVSGERATQPRGPAGE
jgi:serine/threonine protein kinase